MEILNLKDSVEKDTFFRKLPNLADQLPRQIVLKKVVLTYQKQHTSVNIFLVVKEKKFYHVLFPAVASIACICSRIWFSCCTCFDSIFENGFLAFNRGIQSQGYTLLHLFDNTIIIFLHVKAQSKSILSINHSINDLFVYYLFIYFSKLWRRLLSVGTANNCKTFCLK